MTEKTFDFILGVSFTVGAVIGWFGIRKVAMKVLGAI